jgi:hypothetical protein
MKRYASQDQKDIRQSGKKTTPATKPKISLKSEDMNERLHSSTARVGEKGWGNDNLRANSFSYLRIQAKLETGRVGDSYEREADDMAERVTRGDEGPGSFMGLESSRVQPKSKEEAILQKSSEPGSENNSVSSSIENRINRKKG